MASIELPVTAIDFESIKTALGNNLGNYSSWKGYLTTQTGTTILDFTSAVGSSAAVKGLRYFQEAFTDTATSDRGIYSIADMQGVRLARKLPAVMPVQVSYTAPSSTSPQTVALPRFSQFQGGGTYWYTRDAITVATGATVTVNMYQGYTVLVTTSGLGSDNQTFQSNEAGFVVADQDVYVFVNSTELTRVPSGLWNYKGVSAFVDRTSPTGQLLIQFGNDYYGAKPTASDSVNIVYAITSGADANSLSMLTARISQVTGQVSGLSFSALANPAGGANEVSPAQLKHTGAISYGTFNSAVTKNQYGEVALTYPGVVDAITFAQRDIDPTNVHLMNVIQVVLLTSTTWTTAQQAAYIAYLQSSTMYAPYFNLSWGTPNNVTISGKLHCFNTANLSQSLADATTALQNLYALKAGSLSYDITINDIHTVVKAANTGIDWLELYTPTTDSIVSSTPLDAPALSIPVTVGALAPNTYSYAIAVVMPNGVIAPKNWATITTTGLTSSIEVDWKPYPGALSYEVYGRQGSAGYGLLTTVSASTLTWTDTGSVAPTTLPPTSNTTPIQYNNLVSISLTPAYTTRVTRGS